MNKIELIEDLITRAHNLPHRGTTELDALKRRLRLIIKKIFGESSSYLNEIDDISFYPIMWTSGSDRPFNLAWNSGKGELVNFITTLKEDLLLSKEFESVSIVENITVIDSNKIFVVHGHDTDMKNRVARALEKLELEPIILHEQENKGKTIIEKFEANAEVDFAVVLISPDDMAYSKTSQPEQARPRARQNVILELGYFYGKLGRENVVTLVRRTNNLEMPSDILSVVYLDFDEAGAWKFQLGKELRVAGYEVDLNLL